MDEKNIKRGYYFPEKLLKAWEEFHWPSKSFGSSPEASFLIFLALKDLPQIREKAGRLAHSDDLDKAAAEIRGELARALVQSEIQKHIDDLQLDQNELLAFLMQSKAKADKDS